MIMTFDQGPKEVALAPELKNSILHAKMTIAGTELMGADIPKAEPMRSAYLSLSVDDILLCRTLSNVGIGRSKGAHLQTRYSQSPCPDNQPRKR